MSNYFSQQTFQFLTQLANHNDKEWFNEHKQDYEKFVREPALAYISEMQSWIKMISPYYEAIPKKMGGSLMRVYRDVRFSKNKAPYKTNIGIQFRHEIGKDVHAPGFYLHIEPGNSFLGVGSWHPAPDALKAYRDHIVTKPGPYQDAIEHQPFAECYQMTGNSLQRAPKGFDAEHPLIDEIKRKDFIALTPVSDQFIVADDLPEQTARLFGRAQPLQRFLCEALGLRF
ncbi:DUF2461 domain-containing protein [Neptunicella marina]|uniref:DUF2461 domain-containing protein n=1 Tax=Neptunicella marina TaxID=2125989 RepID=A0A8J6IPA4_9ALTE|nr:DUF2461 domain-containing protein [Neptunicella marina]MBC3764299.1 DUF2461 domain-containing protein [Neptunicella marina]